MDIKDEKIINTLDKIKVTEYNKGIIENIKENLQQNNIMKTLEYLKQLKEQGFEYNESIAELTEEDEEVNYETETHELSYPTKLASDDLEKEFIGKLLNELKAIAVYYYPFKECYFVNEDLLNIYKTILFTDADKYASEAAKEGFNFAKKTAENDKIRYKIKKDYENDERSIEDVYRELKKVFTLRKSYFEIPVKTLQMEIANIQNYELYDQMSVEEVKSAIEQVTTTEKFKRAILNKNITDFLVKGDNTLTNGLGLPFEILSNVFKGVRRGETMAFAMPSNAGKSRFTINVAAYIALIHKKKVLVISNEMSEEKMKLCLITTIINSPDMQKLHGKKLHKTESEILEFKYKADDVESTKCDSDGFALKEENETHEEFVNRLKQISTEFNLTIAVTEWFTRQVENYIYFINITDHTNDELKKVIMNYYYKEKVEYIFYDTLKTDIDNIGNGDEIKKTATVLANLAQNFKIFIAATLQLAETSTDPVNLNINDLAVSRTVKEVLDTLCLFKQIHNEDLSKYEYSLNEVDTEFFELKKYENPDVRYYTCVVDKNRAGSKPKLVFRLNLAYNEWNELGYIRIKSENK